MAALTRLDRDRFLNRIQQITDDCVRLSTTDSQDITISGTMIQRLEILIRDINDVTHSVLSSAERDEVSTLVEGLLSEVKKKRESGDLPISYQANRVPSGSGPPKFDISEEQLRFLVNYNFTAPEMAKLLKTSESTIRRRLRAYGIKLRELRAMSVPNAILNDNVKEIIGTNQLIGPNSIRVRLAKEGIHVTRHRVREACHSVDPAGCALRSMQRKNIVRRTYKVAGPNSLWHIDGNHKLIRWQIVIHGCIDGFSRHVNFLKASSNNKAITVFDSFIQASQKFGIPSRVRVDHGSENVDVCTFMEGYRGENRGSAIRGKSAHNQRIERLWVDVWNGVSNEYYDLFSYMEQQHVFDIENPIHRFVLVHVFLPRLNATLDTFTYQYNNHTLSTEHKSPNQLFITGVLQNFNSSSSALQDYLFQVGDNSITETESTTEVNNEDDTEDDTEDEEIVLPISGELLEKLQSEVNVLENVRSVQYGVEIFKNVLVILQESASS